jgi:hypothetical protein
MAACNYARLSGGNNSSFTSLEASFKESKLLTISPNNNSALLKSFSTPLNNDLDGAYLDLSEILPNSLSNFSKEETKPLGALPSDINPSNNYLALATFSYKDVNSASIFIV